MLRETSAGAVVYRRTPSGRLRFLLLRTDRGHWDLPKGNVKRGERLREAAAREIGEETRLPAPSLRFRPGFHKVVRYRYRRRWGPLVDKAVHFFLVEAPAGRRVRVSREHVAHAWRGPRAALSLASFPETRRVLRDATHALAS